MCKLPLCQESGNRSAKVPYSEEEMIQALLGLGSSRTKIINYIYRRVQPIIAFQVIRNPRAVEESRDLLQEGLLILIESLKSGKFSGRSSVLTYLVGICRRCWWQYLRELKRREKRMEEIFPAAPHIAVSPPEMESENEIGLVFQQLPPRCGELLRRYYWDRFDMDSIADRLGYRNADVARVCKCRCQKKLKHYLMAHPDGLEAFRGRSHSHT